MDGLAETKTPGYSHTQRAPLCLILYGFAIYSIILGWMIGKTLGIDISGAWACYSPRSPPASIT